MSIWDQINEGIDDILGKSAPKPVMAPADRHAYTSDGASPKSVYGTISESPLLRKSAHPNSSLITRIMPSAYSSGAVSAPQQAPQGTTYSDFDFEFLNEFATGTAFAASELAEGILINAGSRIKTELLSKVYEWAFVGTAPIGGTTTAFQNRASSFGPPYGVYPTNFVGINACLKTFFRLIRNDAPITCWLPVACDLEGVREFRAGAGYSAETGGAHSRATKLNFISQYRLSGVVKAEFDRMEFWNAHQDDVCLINPLIGTGKATINFGD